MSLRNWHPLEVLLSVMVAVSAVWTAVRGDLAGAVMIAFLGYTRHQYRAWWIEDRR